MAVTYDIFHPREDEWIIDIIETNVSNGETVEIQPSATLKFPKVGRLLRVQCQLTAGDASRIEPILATKSTFNANTIIAENVSDSTLIDDYDADGIPYGLTEDKLYFRSNPNAGNNNFVRTRYLILDGWR